MTHRLLLLLGLLALPLSVGCPTETVDDDDDDSVGDDDDDSEGDDDDDTETNGCVEDSECDGWQTNRSEICEDDECVDGDRSNDPSEAESLETAFIGSINPAGDVDYFDLQCATGAYLVIQTEANPDDNPAFVDTALQLWDSSGTLIADNDDYCAGCPGLSRLFATDSTIYFRCPDDGLYTVSVEEWTTWQSDDPTIPAEGDPSYTYTLSAGVLLDELIEAEPNNDALSAGQIPGDSVADNFFVSSFRAGAIETAGDVDWYNKTIEEPEDGSNFSMAVIAYPLSGSALTADAAVHVNGGAAQLLAHDLGDERFVHMPIEIAGDYQISMGDAANSGGVDHHYFLHVVQLGDNDDESEPNDAPGEASALDQVENGELISGFGRGTLTSADDVDYWSFNASAGDTVTVAFGGRESGSGAVASVAIVDSVGTEIARLDGVGEEDPFLEDVALADGGSYFMEVSSVSIDPESPYSFYRFGLHLTSGSSAATAAPRGKDFLARAKRQILR